METPKSDPVHIVSLGAGVQSSTMALMAAHGEIGPMPAFAVFADTGDEPEEVYAWLEKLRGLLPFQVECAARVFMGQPMGRLSDNIVEYGFSQIPAFVAGDDGKPTIGKRQCTAHWKIKPVHRKIREVLGTKGVRMSDKSVVVWQGISWDEIIRMKPSREPWIEHRFPLIERKMTRDDCKEWLESNGYPVPPKSACDFCPYQDRARWAEKRLNGGSSWETIKKVGAILLARGEYLTPDLKPIDEVDFTRSAQLPDDPRQLLLFGNECEGMCGV